MLPALPAAPFDASSKATPEAACSDPPEVTVKVPPFDAAVLRMPAPVPPATSPEMVTLSAPDPACVTLMPSVAADTSLALIVAVVPAAVVVARMP